MGKIQIIAVCMTALVVSSCAAKKVAATSTDGVTGATVVGSSDDEGKKALQFVQKVSDNALYQQNVVSTKMTFNLKAGSKDITLPASLHMRKDDVIRLQVFIPLLGSEIGRLELTKDYVLIVDRIHKQYIKADYNQIDFLREKGLSFYSLQSLFWNQLFLPGQQKVSESLLKQYNADMTTTANLVPIDFKQGAMTFVWNADKNSGLIENTDITYVSTRHGTTQLTWTYGNFQSFGSKKYPNSHVVDIETTATSDKKKFQLVFDLSGVTADSSWESRTAVSDKYKQVSVEEVVDQMMKM